MHPRRVAEGERGENMRARFVDSRVGRRGRAGCSDESAARLAAARARARAHDALPKGHAMSDGRVRGDRAPARRLSVAFLEPDGDAGERRKAVARTLKRLGIGAAARGGAPEAPHDPRARVRRGRGCVLFVLCPGGVAQGARSK